MDNYYILGIQVSYVKIDLRTYIMSEHEQFVKKKKTGQHGQFIRTLAFNLTKINKVEV